MSNSDRICRFSCFHQIVLSFRDPAWHVCPCTNESEYSYRACAWSEHCELACVIRVVRLSVSNQSVLNERVQSDHLNCRKTRRFCFINTPCDFGVFPSCLGCLAALPCRFVATIIPAIDAFC